MTSLNSSDVRNVATAIFWVLTILITFTGTLLLSHRKQYKLLRRKDFIPLNHLSPWMSDINALIYWWKTKRLPGDRYRILMLLTSAFALGSHFIVGRYITSQPLQGLCDFKIGIIVPPSSPSGFIPRVPPPDWLAAVLAWNARQMSYWNGGIPGIYKKASYNTNFSATGNGVYGSWQCNSSLPDRTYPINTTADDIVVDLLDMNYTFKSPLYKNSMKTSVRTKALSGLLVWSASAPDNQTQLWDVTASYATSFNKTTNQINMHTMNCSINAPAITWALALVPANDTLDQWGQKAYDFLRDQKTLASSFEEIISSLRH